MFQLIKNTNDEEKNFMLYSDFDVFFAFGQ
jgi:hypothetical protein